MRRASLRTLAAVVATSAIGAALGLAGPAAGDGHAGAEPAPSFALRAGRVLPMTADGPRELVDGLVVVRDGRIARVAGADAAPPADLPLIEMPDATVVPGFVAAATGLAGRHAGDESIGAGFRAIDAFDPYADRHELLAHGITTVHLGPGGHRLLSGQGAVVRLADPHADDVVLRAEADLSITLGPAAASPPDLLEYTIPPSPDNEITPAQPQRPASRMTQFLALREAIARATDEGAPATFHGLALRAAWRDGRPLRLEGQSAADLAGALSFMASGDRAGYLVGGADARALAGRIAASGLPLVYTVDADFTAPASDLGEDPRVRERTVEDLRAFRGVRHLAIAPAPGRPTAHLRMLAAMAGRAGLSAHRRLEAITRVPAEILGVADEVGSLAPGRRADLVVLSGDPLATRTHVLRTYVGGRVAFHAPESSALVVQAETVWLGPGEWLAPGEILIEDGRIVEVGRIVGRPPHARVVRGGPGSFATPGLIDAYGHLGLRGDRSRVGPEITLARLIGAPDLPETRTAAAGVTSVLLAPASVGSNGGQAAAVKTAGRTRADRVVRPVAAAILDVPDDPRSVAGRLRSRLEAGKKYLEQWQAYEKKLAEWEAAQAKGEEVEVEPSSEVVETEEATVDPITGTWRATLTGGPLPEPQTGVVAFKLDGTSIEGRIIEPEVPAEVRILGELDGDRASGTIEVDTGGMGTPTWEGTLVEPNVLRGTAGLGAFVTVDFEMTRTDTAAVEFKVSRRRRTTGKDGRPLPPKTDPSLEPIRALLEGRAPLIVNASTAAQIEAVLEALGSYEVAVVIRGGEAAHEVAAQLVDAEAGVIVPRRVLRTDDDGRPVNQGRALSVHGVPFAFQSSAGDGARTLRDVAIGAVERGLSPETALAALTVDAARLLRLDDRIGRLAPGRDGDVVLFSAHPLEASAAVLRVFVSGEEVRP